MPPTISKKTLPARSVQTPLPIEVSAKTVLVGMEFVRAVRRVDDDSVLAMVDVATHPNHIRFVFDLSCGTGKVRELRFWASEIFDPACAAKFTIDQAIAAILGGRDVFRRGDLVVQWIITRPHVSKLIRTGELRETGNRILRGTLERLLKARWVGGAHWPSIGGGK